MEPDLKDKLDKIWVELRSINASSSLTKKNVFKSFILGLVGALGATVGLAILVAVIGYVLNVLGVLPGVGHWFISFRKYL